ncbi:MAG: toll/interleukin-1 receptor domain-containing protein [Clostridia bacterium]|nr:toll/interleukin-1 receptor domain-containing protein [Clostridia bacterium]
MNHEGKTPKVFISYSWTNEEHKKWVLDLAESLTKDGVHVILDVWDLKEGHDNYSFMESSVTSPDVNKVLIICDKGYKLKADNRKSGVGAETYLITPEVYTNEAPEKFIPIVTELGDDGKPCLPIFLRTRIFIDMSDEDKFEIGYETLLRNIYNKPEKKRPALGHAPGFLFNPKEHSTSSHKAKMSINTVADYEADFPENTRINIFQGFAYAHPATNKVKSRTIGDRLQFSVDTEVVSKLDWAGYAIKFGKNVDFTQLFENGYLCFDFNNKSRNIKRIYLELTGVSNGSCAKVAKYCYEVESEGCNEDVAIKISDLKYINGNDLYPVYSEHWQNITELCIVLFDDSYIQDGLEVIYEMKNMRINVYKYL